MSYERLRKPGATLAAVLALGGGAVKLAESQPATAAMDADVPASIEKDNPNLPLIMPEGMRLINNDEEVFAETSKAYQKLSKRWKGVLVLHAPKKNASVSFNESPTAYARSIKHLSFLQNTKGAEISVEPGIEEFKGRTYAVIFDQELGRWGFLDIEFAEEMGALSTYAIKGTRPHTVRYDPSDASAGLPGLQVLDNTPTAKNLTQVIDSRGKVVRIVASSVILHP